MAVMATKTPNLELVELQTADLPAAPAVNESYWKLDTFVQLAVLSATVTAAPADARQGDRYIIPDDVTPADVWDGHARQVAYLASTGWLFRAPRSGWESYVLDTDTKVRFVGATWSTLPTPRTKLTELDDVQVDEDTITDGQILAWNAGDAKFEAVDPPTGGGGGGTVDLPGTIADLQYWFRADLILAASGAVVPVLKNYCPWYDSMHAANNASGGTISTALNSLPTVNFPNGGAGRYSFNAGFGMGKFTFFAVYRPASLPTASTFVSGGGSSIQVRLESSGKIGVNKTNVVGIGTSTGALATGTAYQFNVTYDSGSGAIAFRISQAASGSSSSAQSISANESVIGYNAANGGEDLAGDLAEMIIYNRVLSPTEIGNVEAYLHTKWGV